jgi:hypothetical protein
MAGTVKLTVPPELPCVGELAEAVGRAGGVLVADDLVTAGWVTAAEVAAVEAGADAGVEAGADAGVEPAAVAIAVTEPPGADADAAVDEVGPVPPHAVRPAPPVTTAAMITTGIRHILMLSPFVE